MKFLHKIVDELLSKNSDLAEFNIIFPGKRPVVFFKEILKNRQYSGFLPNFYTIEELVKNISGKQEIKGIALWLFAYEIYMKMYPSEDFSSFLKWFPTISKDWDDMLKFSGKDKEILEFMLDEERIKNWSEHLGEPTETLKKNLNFWKKMNEFLPFLKQKLEEKNWATSGMIHLEAQKNIKNIVEKTKEKYIFCGFNALTPTENELVRTFLQLGKAEVFFQADQYYIEDERQEAGTFLREYKNWKEFNDYREFRWIENDFDKEKNIKVYEVSGNISQTKILPELFAEIQQENAKTLFDDSVDFSHTAVVLLDENLLPATLDSLHSAGAVNITMGFPLKNLSFSNAVKKIFYLQKQLEKGTSSYYYNDVLQILEELPTNDKEKNVIARFVQQIEQRNIVYISQDFLAEFLSELPFFEALTKLNPHELLDFFIEYCYQIKFNDLDDMQYENISHFEKAFKIIKNQISEYRFEIKNETLEVLVNQLINSETIDFQGEPLEGLQIMGLLETRLLNFKNVILVSANEGKLPLGNSQNTYLPFDVRKNFGLHTFLENDSIYAYHFYRLIQDSKNVYLLYNALNSGVNTGEKSRFITQIELESKHKVEHVIIENSSQPISQNPLEIVKTVPVLLKLEEWKHRISATHLTTYLYNPIDFYLQHVLNAKEADEIEEELSVKNYGNLVHYSLQIIYENFKGKLLVKNDLESSIKQINEVVDLAIKKLNHQPEFYSKGMNFVHKNIAKRVIEEILRFDLNLIENGNSLKIIDLERKFENVDFFLDEEKTDKVSFYGYIDRIDQLNGNIRIIDYKTAKSENLILKFREDNFDKLLMDKKRKQALQLVIYQYVINNLPEFKELTIQTGIWSFAEANKGIKSLNFENGDLATAMISVKSLISEILNPEINFIEADTKIWE